MLELVVVSLLQAAAGNPPAQTASPPQATEAAPSAAAAEQAPQRRSERRRARCRVEVVTGSRLGSRVCNSDADMEMLERETRDFLHDVQVPGGTSGG